MFEIKKTKRINRLIDITKSDSMVVGAKLALAHMQLGYLLGRQMSGFKPSETTIIAILRGGIFFAEGIYFKLNCRFEICDPKSDDLIIPATKNIILVDSVINTGKTIERIYQKIHMENRQKNIYVASCVVNKKALENITFKENLYTIRVSNNSFVGSNITKQNGDIGPDTTMRLFNEF
ncbi:hypothetical protein CCY99_01125 [Helicobacter sp. 16-1353]|uniref:phosphoribosyltransferase n=1 Tax=Helicobacter sp. 16-1353 TaxID=2004996 RepID=UPI000DCD9DF8|nr:phosphoribosyltransferase [Helicobacter sp. 16-1353]RAX55330.1 hypothetical protein CCY99_01125 [Helicobacter sp. 16-1353]